ncbi:MAG: YceI family protein [Pseudomonadota bacterium]
MRFRSLLLASTVALAPLPALAQDWEVDPSHTSILFSIGHLGFSDTKGIFRDFDIDVTFDPEDVTSTAATVTIDASSVDTFWQARDEHIRGEDMLHVSEYPEITFATTSVEMVDETNAKITGDLTLRGETRPVIFDASLNRIDANPFDASKRVAGFTLTSVIDRTDFGVDFAAPMVSAEMPVTINIELVGPAE